MASPASDWLRHFRLILWNRWTEFDEKTGSNLKKAWQEARTRRHFSSLCFSDPSENPDGRLAYDWLRQYRLLLWNRWTEFDETTGSNNSTSSTKYKFFGPIGKAIWGHWPLIGWDLLWNHRTKFYETLQEQTTFPMSSFIFSKPVLFQNQFFSFFFSCYHRMDDHL